MRIKSIFSFGLLLVTVILIAGIASCSNPDERPLDTYFPSFNNPLPISPVGLVISDPVFRQTDPDPLIEEAYNAAGLTVMKRADLWAYFTNATQRIDIAGTYINNPDFVSLLVGAANKGVQVNIVAEQGFFDEADAAPLISQLAQTGRVTIKTDHDDIARQVHTHYAIIDDHIVLASSGDFLDSDFNRSINNTVIFNQPRSYVNGAGAAGVKTVTDAFLFDFDQMFNMGKFGGEKETLINHTFNVGVKVEVYFGPNDNLIDPMVEEVNNMQSSMMYAIQQVTDSTMLYVLANFAQIGFYDGLSNGDLTEILPLAVPFAWYGYNTLGHKVMLIDLPADLTNTINPAVLDILDPVVITGSLNWTQSGLNLNDEQLLIIHDMTLGYEFAVELGVLQREAAGYGVVFGTIRTNKNVPIPQAAIACDSEEIPGNVFIGDQDETPQDQADGRGNYALMVPTGFLRYIRVLSLGDASGLYLLPDPIWGPNMPNEGYNLMPGSSYRANFYVHPAPSSTGTGT